METMNDPIQPYSELGFAAAALRVFRRQFFLNPTYHAYCQYLNIDPDKVSKLSDIPFLPISFFKSHEVKTGDFTPELIFRSSGTTGMQHSVHLIRDALLYQRSLIAGFRHFYGNPADYTFLALLPNYLEQKHSSLVYMMDELMRQSGSADIATDIRRRFCGASRLRYWISPKSIRLISLNSSCLRPAG